MMNIYYDKNADMNALKGKTVAVLGYGSQGHAHALNLNDSGVDVVVGLHQNSKSREKVKTDGLQAVSITEAVRSADIVMVLIPDHVQEEVYLKEIEPNLSTGNSLAFAHGFAIHFNRIIPQDDINVFMVAPKGPGHLVRRVFTAGGGVPCLLAVYRDTNGVCKDVALAYAKGIGGTRAGVIETTFKEETETDLFGEQAVLCGGVTELVKAGFETLVEAGYQPEIAYFECLHELKLIVDLFYEGGISGMYYSVSDTAEYGGMTRGTMIIDNNTKERMRNILRDVRDGSFAQDWIDESRNGQTRMNRLRQEHKELLLEQVGSKLRNMMSWI
ncbi:MAG: ketol-acid reductoisomerase [bacterium]|nr:ketol-acid reductoisomerase [bacterium]